VSHETDQLSGLSKGNQRRRPGLSRLRASRDNFAGKIILVVFLVIGAIWLLITTVSQVN
jgi:hypothetical protein